MKNHGFPRLLAALIAGSALTTRAQDTPAATPPPPPVDAAATPVEPRDIAPPKPPEKKPAPTAAKPAKPLDPLAALTGRKKKSKSTASDAGAAALSALGDSDAVLFTILVDGNKERFVVKLRPDLAPKTVANFKKNVESGFYNGLAFHRVIRNYLLQTGDPLSKDDAQKEQWGTTDVGQSIPGEFSGKHVRYAVAMAHKSGETISSGSQFYITLRPISNLDGSYAVFGEVIGGTGALNRLSGAVVDTNDVPLKRIELVDAKIISSTAQLALDEGTPGRRKSKPDSQKGPVEKFIERVW
jgi:cyclophilin family peptidyl-prolyl cis-trans isomerase